MPRPRSSLLSSADRRPAPSASQARCPFPVRRRAATGRVWHDDHRQEARRPRPDRHEARCLRISSPPTRAQRAARRCRCGRGCRRSPTPGRDRRELLAAASCTPAAITRTVKLVGPITAGAFSGIAAARVGDDVAADARKQGAPARIATAIAAGCASGTTRAMSTDAKPLRRLPIDLLANLRREPAAGRASSSAAVINQVVERAVARSIAAAASSADHRRFAIANITAAPAPASDRDPQRRRTRCIEGGQRQDQRQRERRAANRHRAREQSQPPSTPDARQRRSSARDQATRASAVIGD